MQTAHALAMARVSGASVIDVPRVVIDGALPREVLIRRVQEIRQYLSTIAQDGLSLFEIETGEIGADARALGGAILSMSANFSCRKEVLLKR